MPPGNPNGPELIWDRIPSIQIRRAPEGGLGDETDQRCFTYCTQSVGGRLDGAPPRCRSICFRRVFPHELGHIKSIHRTETVERRGAHSHVSIRRKLAWSPADWPLPPEGQRHDGLLDAMLGRWRGRREHDGDDDADHDGLGPGDTRRGPKMWREGWYLWWTRDADEVRKQLVGMQQSVEFQAQTREFMETTNREWAIMATRKWVADQSVSKQERTRRAAVELFERVIGPRMEGGPEEDQGDRQRGDPPFPDTSEHSVLIPFPFPSMDIPDIFGPARRTLEPSKRVLSLTHGKFESGEMREFGRRVFEKAKSDEPWRLAAFAWRRTWDILLKDKPAGDDDDDDPLGKGRREEVIKRVVVGLLGLRLLGIVAGL
ncbi:uncharacterized protein BXZ73DRAFT_104353 [Epithele typhae]|uniref:uncharacterized protein n=1 Tax=Epithele typhae TaxID=378194 RepID=UPI002008637A|nr:uncharacterized protein BXZ73DRAFT_104353 [Epithele typhae]KAH9921734.1 hypothetical protein BXZ73DRAFT_104353 [Epithele typhae]